MKKLTIVLVTAGLVIGSATAVFAATTSNGQGILNFGQMLPYMQQMHPGWTTQQYKDMYNTCVGAHGAAPSKNQSMNPSNQAMMLQ